MASSATPARTSTSGRSRRMYRRRRRQPGAARVRLRGHAARRADRGAARPRRREAAGPIRHMCSGQHSVFLLLSQARAAGSPTTYWLRRPPGPGRVPRRRSRGRSGRRRSKLRPRIDGCGIATYAFPLREIARAYAFLADPEARPGRRDPRTSLAPALTSDPRRDARPSRDGRRARRDRLDTSLMKAAPRPARQQGRDGGACAASAILPGPRGRRPTRRRPGSPSRSRTATATSAGRGRRRSRRCARPASSTGQALRVLARYHRPIDPSIRTVASAAEAIAEFELAPLGELDRLSPTALASQTRDTVTPRDPYRTLGLSRGASLAEIKRAYRRLAKAYHPDAAGEAALPRFLAIQAAYEQLASDGAVEGGASRARSRRGRRRRATPTARDADAPRLRRSRRAGARDRSDVRRPARDARCGARPGRAADPAGLDAARRTATGAAARGEAPAASAAPGARPSRKATLGSTSYDEADATRSTRRGAAPRGTARRAARTGRSTRGVRRSAQARPRVPGPGPAGRRGPSRDAAGAGDPAASDARRADAPVASAHGRTPGPARARHRARAHHRRARDVVRWRATAGPVEAAELGDRAGETAAGAPRARPPRHGPARRPPRPTADRAGPRGRGAPTSAAP